MAFNGGSAGASVAGRSSGPFGAFGRSPSPNPTANPFATPPAAPQLANPFATGLAPTTGAVSTRFGFQPAPAATMATTTNQAPITASPFQTNTLNPFGGAGPNPTNQALPSTGLGTSSGAVRQSGFGAFGQGPSGATTGFGSLGGSPQMTPSFAQRPTSPFSQASVAQLNGVGGSSQQGNPFKQPSTANSGFGAPSAPGSAGGFAPPPTTSALAIPQSGPTPGSNTNRIGFGSRQNGSAAVGSTAVTQFGSGFDKHKRNRQKDVRGFGNGNPKQLPAARKPNFSETLEMRGSFVTANASGQYTVNRGVSAQPDLNTESTSSARARSKQHNPFQALSESQPGPFTSRGQNGLGSLSSSSRITTLEEYATAIHNQLKKDNIRDLVLPANFGDPANRASLQIFKDKHLKRHRVRVRESLEAARLIDRENVQINLKDAIDFRGICEDMCPVYEVLQRTSEGMDKLEERAEGPDGTLWACPEKFVKQHTRSSAGEKAILPMEVRSIPALERTLNYLLDDLLQDEHNLRDRHAFLWDRLRAVRRDFIFQTRLTPEEIRAKIKVLETIARFHAISHHLLAKKGGAYPDYSAYQERESLQKTLMSLKETYADARKTGIECENEVEFISYWILYFTAQDPSAITRLDKETRHSKWAKSNQIQTAISLAQAFSDFRSQLRDMTSTMTFPTLAAGESATYFDIVADPSVSYTMACVAETLFPPLRDHLLRTLVKACARNRDPPRDITAAVLKDLFKLDSEEEAVEFVQDRGLSFSADGGFLILDNRNQAVTEIKTPLMSHRLVERKRCNRPLLDVIRNNVFEQDVPPDTVEARNPASPDSMFVEDHPPPLAAPGKATTAQPVGSKPASPFAAPPTASYNPFAQSSSNASKINGVLPASTQGGSSAPPRSSSSSAAPLSQEKSQKSQSTFGSELNANPFAGLRTSTTASTSPAAPAAPTAKATTQAAFPSTTTPFTRAALPAAAPHQSPNITVTPPTPPTSIFQGTGIKAPIINSFSKPAAPPASSRSLDAAPAPSTATSSSPATPGMLAATATQRAKRPLDTGPAQQQQQQQAQQQSKHPPGVPGGFRATASVPSTAKPAVNPALSKPAFAPTRMSALPKKDALGDFAKWFVLGDHGLLEEFRDAYVEHLVRQTYMQFLEDEVQRKREEEDQKSWEEALTWRRYNLGLKFFYRWRDAARNKALARRAREGRELMKSYRETQLAQQKAEKKAAAKKKRTEDARRASLLESTASHFVDDLAAMQDARLHSRRRSSLPNVEDDLLATGVFSGMRDEREAASEAIRDDDSVVEALLGPRPRSPSPPPGKHRSHLLKSWKESLSRSASKARTTAKAVFSSTTRDVGADRSFLIDGRPNGGTSSSPGALSRSPSLSRSLPAKGARIITNFTPSARKRMAPSEDGPNGAALDDDRLKRLRSSFNTSRHFRLRAMGMVHMPNGQYLHESLARPLLEGRRFAGIGDYGVVATMTTPVANGEGGGHDGYDNRAGAVISPAVLHHHQHKHHHRQISAPQLTPPLGRPANGAHGSALSKRKRLPADDQAGRDHNGAESVMSGVSSIDGGGGGRYRSPSPSGSSKKQKKWDLEETERVIREMRETAALMQEGESWYREQSALLGRGETPWS